MQVTAADNEEEEEEEERGGIGVGGAGYQGLD